MLVWAGSMDFLPLAWNGSESSRVATMGAKKIAISPENGRSLRAFIWRLLFVIFSKGIRRVYGR